VHTIDTEYEDDSDMGLDHSTIQHLVGDIAEDIFGDDGNHLCDFKPTPRKTKSGSNHKNKGEKKIGSQSKRSR
jgi:hypothetical protein